MSLYLIGYIVLVLLLLMWILRTPHTPTSLDPEPASVWDFPGWYMLIMLLILIGFIIAKATN